MSFRSVIASSTKQLSSSERKVMAVLLSGERVSEAPAAEVAQRAGTHESTVVRLAQKLGYRGYPDLRADLQRDEGQEGADREAHMRADSGHHLYSFASDEAAALERLAKYVPQEVMEAAAKTIDTSKTIYVFSDADDERPLRDLAARRMRRLGFTVVTLENSAKDLAENMVGFDSDSTLIAYALREASVRLAPLMSECQRRGGRVVLISDVPGFHFRPNPDHLLAAPRGDDSGYRTPLVPIALTYSLQLAVFHLDRTRYGAVRSQIDDLTRHFGGAEESPRRS